MALLYLCYGLKRLTLGIDFTDEGAYLSWPLRMLFGEKPFAAELGTLLRPFQAYLYLVFKIHPAMTLYEFRLLGWLLHLLSFCLLSTYLFHLSRKPLESPLVASVPFFVCHIFGLAPPSYNISSSDFLLIALSLRGLAAANGSRWPTALNIAGGFALFLGTLAHPVLGLVGAAILLYELIGCDLVQNLFHRRLTPSNMGALVFVACWLAFAGYLVAIGAHAVWFQRMSLFQSLAVQSHKVSPVLFYLQLFGYPFAFSRFALLFTLAAFTGGGVLLHASRTRNERRAATAAALLALLLIVSLIYNFSYDPGHLPICLAQAALILLGLHCLGCTASLLPIATTTRFSLLLSGLAAVAYATVTFYFSPFRSWISGILALPFAFATGLTLLLGVQPGRFQSLFRTLSFLALVLAVACVAREHYRSIYRDATVDELRATFRLPKLRHIRSTQERVDAIDALYEHLHPKLARGEPLLVFDDCPMLYYLFDAMPAYGLTFATRYTQSPMALRQLNQELNAKPLPQYAIRTLVDVSESVWATARQSTYNDYPLNETVMANYELEKTIFPFEIWRMKTADPRK